MWHACLSSFCAGISEYQMFGNFQRKSLSLTVLDAGKFNVKVLASHEGLLAVSFHGGKRESDNG